MRIAGFYENSSTNGDGWRSVLFVGGCPHKCKGCQNPQTWNYDYGEEVTNLDHYVAKIIENKRFIDGITLSGGEPFQKRNIDHLLELVKEVKKHGLNVWCYSGYLYEELESHKEYKTLLEEIDVLVDGRFEEETYCPDIKFRGSANQRIIDVKQSIKNKKIIEYTN